MLHHLLHLLNLQQNLVVVFYQCVAFIHLSLNIQRCSSALGCSAATKQESKDRGEPTGMLIKKNTNRRHIGYTRHELVRKKKNCQRGFCEALVFINHSAKVWIFLYDICISTHSSNQ